MITRWTLPDVVNPQAMGAMAVLLCTLLVTACGGSGAASSGNGTTIPTRTDTSAQGDGKPCADYVLSVGELTEAEAAWPAKREAMTTGAHAWYPAAKLVRLSIDCPFFLGTEGTATPHDNDAITWNGVYYAPDAPDGGYWHSEDGSSGFLYEETPIDPAAISFAALRDWLLAAGYDDATDLAAGVTVTTRPNASGPNEDHVSYVVDVASASGALELIVDGRDGTVREKTF